MITSTSKLILTIIVSLALGAESTQAMQKKGLHLLNSDPWPFISKLAEGYLFTNNGFVNGFTYGDGFELTKLWEYPFSAENISYERNYVLLSNKHAHIIIEATTGQLISYFTYEMTTVSMELVLLNAQVVIKIVERSEDNFIIKYLDMRNQAEIKRFSISAVRNNNKILHDGNVMYVSFPNGIVKGMESQDRELWATDLEITQNAPIAQIINIGDDKLGVITQERDPSVYILNKDSGAILKLIRTKKHWGEYSPVEVAEDDQNIYIGGDTIEKYSKSNLKRIASGASYNKRNDKIVVDDKYLYTASQESGDIQVYDKFSLELLTYYNFGYLGLISIEQFIKGPNHSLAIYFTSFNRTGEFEGWSSEHVNTFKFTP